MFRLRDAFVLIVLFLACAQTAHAFIDPPWITPADPRAGEIVSVNIRMGICDAIAEEPGYPQITQEGNAIRIIEFGTHQSFEDFCIFDIGTATKPIGAFPPGDYVLTVDFLYDNYPDGYATITLGVIPFTVAGATPAAPVPTSDPLSLLALMLLLPAFGVWMLRTPMTLRTLLTCRRKAHASFCVTQQPTRCQWNYVTEIDGLTRD